VNAGNVTTLTGAFADVLAAYDANTGAGITGLGDEAVTISDSVTVAQANQIAGATSGLVTATISDGDLATLATLAANDNLSVTVTDTSAAAADLIAVDAATRLAIGASAVQTLTGTAADVVTVYQANAATGITGLGDEAVTLSDTTLAATVLNDVDSKTTGVVDAGSVTTLTGAAAAVQAAYAANAATGITGLGDEAVTLSDATLAAGTLNTIDTYTAGVVDASAATTLTGFAAALLDAYAADAAGTITGLDNEDLVITGGTLSSTQLLSLDSYTTGIISDTGVSTLTVDDDINFTTLGGDVATTFSLLDMNDGTTGQTVTLDFAAALALVTDGNPATVDTLTIDGDANDTVNLNGFSATGYDFNNDGFVNGDDDNYNDGTYNYYWGTDGTNIVIVKVLMDVTTTPTP
jgi:hypothetical protein